MVDSLGQCRYCFPFSWFFIVIAMLFVCRCCFVAMPLSWWVLEVIWLHLYSNFFFPAVKFTVTIQGKECVLFFFFFFSRVVISTMYPHLTHGKADKVMLFFFWFEWPLLPLRIWGFLLDDMCNKDTHLTFQTRALVFQIVHKIFHFLKFSFMW